MALKEEKRSLRDHEVFARQWPATKSMEMKAKLVKVAGMDILPFVEGKPDLTAMMRLESHAEHTELVALIKEFVCTVRMDGKEITPTMFDTQFKGDLWLVIELFAFACEVQYKHFFEQGLTKLEELNQQAQEQQTQ